MAEQVQNPYLRLAAAVVLTAARDACKGSLAAARWLADPNGGLFFTDACGFDLPWNVGQTPRYVKITPGKKSWPNLIKLVMSDKFFLSVIIFRNIGG